MSALGRSGRAAYNAPVMPPLPLSPRILATEVPPIPTARDWATRYDGAAGPALDLTQAVPGYPPHPELLARLAEATSSRAHAGYGRWDGDPALREALAAEITRLYGGAVGADDLAITAGSNLGFAMAMSVIAGPGDSVLLPTPWYFNHRMALEMQGVRAVPLPCRAEDGFLPDPDQVGAALRAGGIRALVLVTPNNPTGAVYPPELIVRCAALCRDAGAWLVLDEAYRDFLPPETPPHPLFQDGAAAWREGVVHLYSFSKSYCVAGHRVGAIAAGPAVRAQLIKALDTYQICPPRPTQAALAWAIGALDGWRAGNREVMAARGSACRRAVSQLPGWRIDALGTYFAYLRLPEDAPDALQTAERLAAERGLLGLPGPFFGPGQERHLRLAFANAEIPMIEAISGRLSLF
jgi:aspartate/methionine/tyrosine aminotransferase